MKKIKRDQRPYELVQQHLSGLILGTILRIVEDLGDPYQAKPGLGGMTAYTADTKFEIGSLRDC